MHVLLIEDNADLAASLCEFLEDQHWTVDWAADGDAAWRLTATGGYDALVLDLMLPGMDGLEFARRLRGERHDNTPILILTARENLDDKLAGFEAGADDYLVKPFSLLELQARLGALLQRGRRSAGTLRLGALALDLDAMAATLRGQPLHLTPIARRLLVALMSEAPQVVERERLSREIWGDEPPDSDALRAHIHALRRALGEDGDDVPRLVTVPTVGYRLTGPDA